MPPELSVLVSLSTTGLGLPPPHTHINSLMCVLCVTSALQDVRRGRPAIREEEVDPLFRRRHGHYILRCAQRLRPGPGRGWRDGEDGAAGSLQWHVHLHPWWTFLARCYKAFNMSSYNCAIRFSLQLIECSNPKWLEPFDPNYLNRLCVKCVNMPRCGHLHLKCWTIAPSGGKLGKMTPVNFSAKRAANFEIIGMISFKKSASRLVKLAAPPPPKSYCTYTYKSLVLRLM